MPVKDGYEATREIRKREAGLNKIDRSRQIHLPIVALTAYALSGDAEKCYKAGMDDYLTKPFNFQRLEQVLEKWLGKQRIIKSVTKIHDTRPKVTKKVDAIDNEAIDKIRILAKDDSSDLLAHLIKLYQDDSKTLLTTLSESIEKADKTSICKTSHALKSSSATIGAKHVAELCKTLELTAEQKSIEQINTLYKEITSAHQHACEMLNNELMQT